MLHHYMLSTNSVRRIKERGELTTK